MIDDLDSCEHRSKSPEPRECAFGDPMCPCQDGDPCHYVDHGDTKAMIPSWLTTQEARDITRSLRP